jgi:hypothetical protein
MLSGAIMLGLEPYPRDRSAMIVTECVIACSLVELNPGNIE